MTTEKKNGVAAENRDVEATATQVGSNVITLNLEEIPVKTRFSDGGESIEIKVFLTNAEIKRLTFVESKDFADVDAALEEAGEGKGHTVTWKIRQAGTYKMLGQYGHEGEPSAAEAKYPAPCLFGDWTVKVRGITATTYESKRTGETGVSFSFVGVRPLTAADGEMSIPFEELSVKDLSKSDDDE